MHNSSREAFQTYLSRQADLNNVNYVSGSNELKFSVEPEVEQTMETRVREQADFLQSINVYGVRDLKGQKLSMDTTSSIASRTNTNEKDRKTSDPTGLDDQGYELHKTDFDTHVRYEKVDQWSRFPDFQTRMRDVVLRQIAIDRMTIGFNGQSAARDTDRAANPLLQDVNIGWLEHIRQHQDGSRHLDGISIGKSVAPSNGYKNLDQLVMDVANSMIEPWHRTNTNLKVISGRQLMNDKYVAEVGANDAPTERNALQTIMLNRLLGGLRSNQIPFFPENAILICIESALSIYWQEGSRRRTIVDKAERDCIQDFQSVNEGYIIEDFGACALIENINIVEEPTE